MRCVSVFLVVVAAGCTGPVTGPASTAPPPAAAPQAPASRPVLRDPLAPVPVIRVVAGRPDTLLVAELVGAGRTVAVAPASGPGRARLVEPGLLVVEAAEPGLFLVSITVDGARLALAVEAAPAAASAPASGLVARVLGTGPDDPSQLRLEVREVDAAGQESLPTGLDDEQSVVALDGNRLLDDNAIFFDPDVGELTLDLDALDGGARRLRLAVRDGGRVSPWIEVEVRDRRLPAESD